MTIIAKFAGTCHVCRVPIVPGARIEWTRGSRVVRHTDCSAPAPIDGRPIDTSGDTSRPARGRRAPYRSTYTRFSSGAEVFTNARGRCEDAPCCGCCS